LYVLSNKFTVEPPPHSILVSDLTLDSCLILHENIAPNYE
jgi:hypothetical protein